MKYLPISGHFLEDIMLSIRKFITQESFAWDIGKHTARLQALMMKREGIEILPSALLIIPTPGITLITNELKMEMEQKGMNNKNWVWKTYQHLYHIVGFVHINKYAQTGEKIAIQIGR